MEMRKTRKNHQETAEKKTIKPIGTKHQICTKQSSETKSETTVLTVESLYLKDLRIGFSVSNRFSGSFRGERYQLRTRETRPLPYIILHLYIYIIIYILYPLYIVNEPIFNFSLLFFLGEQFLPDLFKPPPGSVSGPVETPAATSASVIPSHLVVDNLKHIEISKYLGTLW